VEDKIKRKEREIKLPVIILEVWKEKKKKKMIKRMVNSKGIMIIDVSFYFYFFHFLF
jgi:hypothetical protein